MYRKPYINIYLEHNFDFDEAKAEVDFAFDMLFNYTYKDYMLGKQLKDWQLTKLLSVIKERVSTRKPIQQIIGQAYFYSKKFFVDENTLIPRPETEMIVAESLKILENIKNPTLLDIGTGSGCIPIAIALNCPPVKIEAVDISPKALEIAQRNAIFHNVQNQIKFYQSDLFENVQNQFNIIVSNPPYIPLKDKDSLEIEVKNFDPYNALFTSDVDGTEFYEKITKNAKKYLQKDGFLLFEIGINQSQKVCDILETYNFKVLKVLKDLNSIDRMIIAQYR